MAQSEHTNVEAKMILHLEASRVHSINEAIKKEKQPVQSRQELLDQFSKRKEPQFIWYSCTENIKAPTMNQMMELRFGDSMKKAKEEAKEHFKAKENG